MTPELIDLFDMRIRIIGCNAPTSVNIYFTHLGTSVDYDLDPYEIYNYSLNNTEKQAVFNEITGTTNFSIHITASNPVSVFACEAVNLQYGDVTNILPITALGTEYYSISYNSFFNIAFDAYAVVATQSNTHLYHNGDSVPPPEPMK
jgi:hypothetical protein